MGINFSYAALLARARESGVRFDDILTIGHLNLYLSPGQARRLARRFPAAASTQPLAGDRYADRFFRETLGARSVLSLDYSSYEGCDVVHDMNRPVETALHDRFDAVIDGGSLEHIFHFPVAIANCMNMVKVGGSLFLITMANNHAGHGFYQFSPELFFRVFQPENGYELQNVILEVHGFPGGELSAGTTCYSVTDPAELKTRVGLVTHSPVMMIVHAIKRESKPPFVSFPLQSDYASRFQIAQGTSSADSRPPAGLTRNLARTIYRWLPAGLRNRIVGFRQLREYSLSNRRFYRPYDPLE